MFETVVPETVAPRSRRLMMGTLPLSLAVHALLAASAVSANLWSVQFPSASPALYSAYALIATPPPPPPPPPPPRRAPSDTRVVPKLPPDTAPRFVPDDIPLVSGTAPEEPYPEGDGDDFGVEGGVDGGVAGGVAGGVLDAAPPPPPPPPPPKPEILEVKRDEPLPVGAIDQLFPPYPEYARTRGWEDTLVVRYLIGKDGRVKEVKVIQPPGREEFTRTTLETIRHWRFHPYRDENGEPMEVSHELTVQFRVRRVAQ